MLKKVLQNILLFILSLVVVAGAFELLLRTGWFDNPEGPAPVWISQRLKDRNDRLNEINRARANRNWYEFNNDYDIVTAVTAEGLVFRHKAPGTVRVAVLGDSFIWGTGTAFSDIWSTRLREKIASRYDNVEFFGWGKPGWETLDQFKFISELVDAHHSAGLDPGLDLLIVGFVTNDPNMGRFTPKMTVWQDSKCLAPFKRVFRDSTDFMIAYVNRFLDQHVLKDHFVSHWEERLYTDENLEVYGRLLKDFSSYLEANNIRLLYVMTPAGIAPKYGERHEIIKRLMDEAGIEYLDLYPAVKENFADVNPRMLWANPADGHPGPMLTELYASEVFKYLDERGLIAPRPERQAAARPDASEYLKLMKDLYANKKVLALK